MVTTLIRIEKVPTVVKKLKQTEKKHVHQIYPLRTSGNLLPGHLWQSLQIFKVLVYRVWSLYFYSFSEWSLLTATCHHVCHHHHYPCVLRPLVSGRSLVSSHRGHTHNQPLIWVGIAKMRSKHHMFRRIGESHILYCQWSADWWRSQKIL